ncbi:MAG: competence protein ComK [Bacillales bacterium]|nr:competence protein ComK [Bacillales bacterium]
MKYYVEEKNYRLFVDGIEMKETYSLYIKKLAEGYLKELPSLRRLTKKIFLIERNIPLYLSHNLLLIQIKENKNRRTLLINYQKILKYTINKEKTLIWFDNGSSLTLNISSYRSEKIMRNAEKISDYFRMIDY